MNRSILFAISLCLLPIQALASTCIGMAVNDHNLRRVQGDDSLVLVFGTFTHDHSLFGNSFFSLGFHSESEDSVEQPGGDEGVQLDPWDLYIESGGGEIRDVFQDDVPSPFSYVATFSGHIGSAEGFVTPSEFELEVSGVCVEGYCGSSLQTGTEALAILRIDAEGGYRLESGACSQAWHAEPSAEELDHALSCLGEGGC